MTTIIFVVFCIVYLGMILGGLPFLQLDRTGIALLGAIALIGVEAVSPEEAAKSIHLPMLILLFSFMVVSAPMRLGGFYARFRGRPASRFVPAFAGADIEHRDALVQAVSFCVWHPSKGVSKRKSSVAPLYTRSSRRQSEQLWR